MIYVASKSTHGEKWRDLRARLEGRVVICSSWIDESGEGETVSWSDLWINCIIEASDCDALVAYHEAGEEWKGAFVEIGAALAANHPVYIVGDPPGSWREHPFVHIVGKTWDDVEKAVLIASRRHA